MLSMIFHSTIKRFSVRFCAFLFLVVFVDVDAPACVDGPGAGTVFHVNGMASLGVGPLAVAPPAKRR